VVVVPVLCHAHTQHDRKINVEHAIRVYYPIIPQIYQSLRKTFRWWHITDPLVNI